jgi:hypothetical protein
VRSDDGWDLRLDARLRKALNTICTVLGKLERTLTHTETPVPISTPLGRNVLYVDLGLAPQTAFRLKTEAFRRLKCNTLSRDDLLALGPLPMTIIPLLSANEPVLRMLFQIYSLTDNETDANRNNTSGVSFTPHSPSKATFNSPARRAPGYSGYGGGVDPNVLLDDSFSTLGATVDTDGYGYSYPPAAQDQEVAVALSLTVPNLWMLLRDFGISPFICR